MCNAYNHPPGCRCGWGGDGHLGISSNYHSHIDSTSDYCRLCLCPHCKQPVFFIRHNGGSVWVDELGPPWPKHPCFEQNTNENCKFSSWANEVNEIPDQSLALVMRREANSTREVMLEVRTVRVIKSEMVWGSPVTIFVYKYDAPELGECFFISYTNGKFSRYGGQLIDFSTTAKSLFKIAEEVDAHCRRCKMTMFHIITSVEQGRPTRVECKTCNMGGFFQKPKDTKIVVMEALPVKSHVKKANVNRPSHPGQGSKSFRSRRTEEEIEKDKCKNELGKIKSQHPNASFKMYGTGASFSKGDLIHHPQFGNGYVVDVEEGRVKCFFGEEFKKLTIGAQGKLYN